MGLFRVCRDNESPLALVEAALGNLELYVDYLTFDGPDYLVTDFAMKQLRDAILLLRENE